jgi:hypothetical protein
MTRQLRARDGFDFGAATVELAVNWKQDRKRSLSGQETFTDPGFIPPDPRVLLDEFLKLVMEDRDVVVAFLEKCGYLVDEPRPQPKVAYVKIDGKSASTQVKRRTGTGLKRAVERKFGAWNFVMDSESMQRWLRRRRFLEQWLTDSGNKNPQALSKNFSEEFEDANRAFRPGLAWKSGAPRLSLYVADAWEAILAVAHIQKMKGTRRRPCLRPGCTKLIAIISGSGQKMKYCCTNCRLANNSRRYRARQHK